MRLHHTLSSDIDWVVRVNYDKIKRMSFLNTLKALLNSIMFFDINIPTIE